MEFNAAAIDAAATGFQALFVRGGQRTVSLASLFCLPVESTHSQETYDIPEGTGELREWVGPREEKPSLRWEQTIANKDWESTMFVPRNAYVDDNLAVYRQQAEMMGVSAKTHPDKLVTDLLRGGFATKGYDKVNFFSANHPLVNGGVQANLVSGALSATTFRTGLAQLQGMTDYYGRPLELAAMGVQIHLMVGPGLRATADSIVSVDVNASGAGNVDFQQAKTVINPRLIGDYANYWFLLAGGGPVYPLILQTREAPEMVVITDPQHPELFSNKRVPHGVSGRWNAGYGFYQLAQGSTGS